VTPIIIIILIKWQGLQPVVSAASSMGSGNMDLGEELELVPQEASLEAFRDIVSAPF
jgi:hypothetical protein